MENHFMNSIFFVWLFCLLLSTTVGAYTSNNCSSRERKALFAFKKGLSDPSARLSSWVGHNCCEWHGITCNLVSGKVTKIDLHNSLGSTLPQIMDQDEDPERRTSPDPDVFLREYEKTCLKGEISSSLLELKYLSYLDLSMNDFEGAPIPYFFGMLKNLTYLNLSSANFSGQIPIHLGHLSNLNHLDLSDGHGPDILRLSSLIVDNLQWLSGLSSLEYLNLGALDLSTVQANSMHAINGLSSLSELHLSCCDISGFDTLAPFLNLSSLRVLDLSFNWINSSILSWLSNLTSLSTLDLSGTLLADTFPKDHTPSFPKNLCKLRFLHLAANDLEVKLEEFLDSFSNCSRNRLEFLDLELNRFWGEIPNSLGTFKNLRFLDLSDNQLWGSLPNSIGNLSLLQHLDISYNSLNGIIPSSFGQLSNLVQFKDYWNSWKNTTITEKHLVNLTKLEIFRIFPENKQAFVFNISSDWIPPFRLKNLYLKHCFIGHRFPVWLRTQTQLIEITLSDAGISGSIPYEWISNVSSQLVRLDLANNNLHGKIPTTIGSLTFLNLLILSNNNLHGEIPKSLQNCSLLTSLDLSENRFLYGNLPSWIGGAVKKLELLNLRSNLFSGTIPRQWCNLFSLHVLDLSNNRLSGEVPSCLYNWKYFVHYYDVMSGFRIYHTNIGVYNSYEETTKLVMKGVESEYNNILDYVLTIDLSRNKLNGEIPKEITKLAQLETLNLSNNNFVGIIPEKIGAMKNLQTLDLSRNHLFGRIPYSLASLTFLTHLNMSFNNLTGRIPTGNQLQTLEDPSIYEGNPSLCGSPLQIKCPGDESSNIVPKSTSQDEDGKEDDSEVLGFYISMAIGFPVGINILFFTIFTNQARRIFYFRFIDRLNYNILQTIDFLTIGMRRMIIRRSY